jgi:nucleotide-binding universal stress UspA family protein
MKRFMNILVICNDVPGSDDALTQAAALAAANGARLTLIDLCPTGSRTPTFIAEREKRLQRSLRSLDPDGIPELAALVLRGDGHDDVIKQVLRAGHDLVIASSEGGSGLQNALYGSLATALMRRCPCPVWIVKPGQSNLYRRVLAAVDIDPGQPDPDALTGRVFEMASSLAAGHGAELHVLHAWDVTGPDAETIHSEVPDTTRARLLDDHETTRRTVLAALMESHRLDGPATVLHMPRGTPAKAIVETAHESDIDIVVMGTKGRSGLAGLLVGNTAEMILAAVRCGVLTVRPDSTEAAVLVERTRDVA